MNKRQFLILLFGFVFSNSYSQADSTRKPKPDFLAIRSNVFQMINLGAEFFPAKHHSLGAEFQVFGLRNLKMGTASSGVQRLYLDYRYYAGKSGSSGLFVGGHFMQKTQHIAKPFSDPRYHGVGFESMSDGVWAGGTIGYRKRFPIKVFVSVFLGMSYPLLVEFQYIDRDPSGSYYPKKPRQEARGGLELGILF